jgi:hypothetical protein
MLEQEDLRQHLVQARAAIHDEQSQGFLQLTRQHASSASGDPGALKPVNPGQTRTEADIISLRRKFTFLKDFSDQFIKTTPLEVLLKTETTAMKLKDLERNRSSGTRLSNNRDELPGTFFTVTDGQDNRWNSLHEARFLPGACCSATYLWSRAREVLGGNVYPAVSTYDMNAVGLGGFVSKRGWIEIQDLGSDSMALKLFNINGCGNKVSTKPSESSEEFCEIAELGEFQLALRVAREAMGFVHPWNKSISAIEGFLFQTDYCKQDLQGVEKPALVLTQFVDYIFMSNSDRWRGQQPFLTTGDLRGTWASFWGARPESKIKSKGASSSQGQRGNIKKFVFDPSYFDDICRLYNLGRCMKAPGTCTTKAGVPLRHVCNYIADKAKPKDVCGKTHPRSFNH